MESGGIEPGRKYALGFTSIISNKHNYEDLEPIARLRLKEAAKELSKGRQEKLSAEENALAVRGLLQGSALIRIRLRSWLEYQEGLCQAVQDVWLDLILKRNRGNFSREDIDFIVKRVRPFTVAPNVRHSSSTAPMGPSGAINSTGPQAEDRMHEVAVRLRNALEIKFREQEAFWKDASFWAFLRSFGGDWTGLVSGLASAPFAILAWLFPGVARAFFGLLAVAALVFSAYHIWRKERLQGQVPGK